MAIEIDYLVASIALFAVMILVQAVLSDIEYGLKYGLSARDNVVSNGLFTQRAMRANANMVEGLLIFVPLILVAVITDRLNAGTALGATVFFWCRLAYAPLYWFGVPWLRTLVWFGSLIGAGIVFFQIIPFIGGGT